MCFGNEGGRDLKAVTAGLEETFCSTSGRGRTEPYARAYRCVRWAVRPNRTPLEPGTGEAAEPPVFPLGPSGSLGPLAGFLFSL